MIVCSVCRKPPLTAAKTGEHCQRDCTGLDCRGTYVKPDADPEGAMPDKDLISVILLDMQQPGHLKCASCQSGIKELAAYIEQAERALAEAQTEIKVLNEEIELHAGAVMDLRTELHAAQARVKELLAHIAWSEHY